MEQLLQLDSNILLWIQEYLRSDFFTPIWKMITSLCDDGWFWLAISAIMLLFKKTRKTGFLALLSIAFCYIICNLVLKNLVARPRPYTQIPELTILIEPLKSYSFPSGHTANSFAVAMVYYRMLPKKYGVAAMILAGFISFSRLYLGVHYPTDVIGGVVIAWVCISIVYLIYSYVGQRTKVSATTKDHRFW